MIRQSTSKRAAPPTALAAANAVIWAIYVALVLLVPWVLAFSDPVGVTASVLVAAVVFLPLRRRMTRAARRRFTRLPGFARGG
jgi:threonine/homoserine efflux transporter RhtA